MLDDSPLWLGLLLVLAGGLVALAVWLIVRLATRAPGGGDEGGRDVVDEPRLPR
jgi:H+/Cl- antiporter ClcA